MTGQQPVLIVIDDEAGILDVVSRFAVRAGFEVIACNGGREGIARVESAHADLVMVDLRMPDIGGLEVLRAIRESNPDCRAVLMTGYASVDTAVEAIKLGAMDYLSKPLDFARLQQLFADVREEIERRHSVLSIERDLARRLEFCGMIGRGSLMQDLFALIRRLAPHVRTALLTGETGTGKELVARALHRTGPRRDRRFVTVNCSAVVETLFESELFGHVRGAFTGATEHKPGLFEAADGGTLFLDEIGELSAGMQAKLLRVLEKRRFTRVGGTEEIEVDVRVVCATHRDLEAETRRGTFRADLFFRISAFTILIPPLRDRPGEIVRLAELFVRQLSGNRRPPLITPAAAAALRRYPWPGNVRELRNAIERAVVIHTGHTIELEDLPDHVREGAVARGEAGAPVDIRDHVAGLERDAIDAALQACNGNQTEAARRLGISRRTLIYRMEKHGLKPPPASRAQE